MKVLMLVLASDAGVYDEYQRQWSRIFARLNRKQVEAYFYKSRDLSGAQVEVSGNTVYVNLPETYANLHPKTMLAMRAFQHRFLEFDWIVRPNMSSFFHIDRYLAYLESLPRKNCIEGSFVEGYDIQYASGSGYAVTPDVMNRFLCVAPPLFKDDDITLGKFAQEHRVQFIPRHLQEIHEENFTWVLKRMLAGDRTLFHIRTKTPNPANREKDVQIFRRLVDAFYSD